MRGLKRGLKTLLDNGILGGRTLLKRLWASLREHECHITVVNQVITKTERTVAKQLEMGERGDTVLTGNVESLFRVRGKP